MTIHRTTPLLLSMLATAAVPTALPAALGVMAWSAPCVHAQVGSGIDEEEANRNKRETLIQLSKPVTLEVEEQPLEDIFSFLASVTGAELEPVYLNDDFASLGMDPATPVTISVTQRPALIVLERVLARAQRAGGVGEEYTWQLTDYGTVQLGPKTELNREQRIEIYDVADLLYVVPDFDNAPDFDLQSAVQAAGGGGQGGGQSPFSGGGAQDADITSLRERAEALRDLITSTVEPDQWRDLGGDGASITIYNQSFIVTGPDYVHRQLAGYPFWPARLQQIRRVDGRQQVKIKPSTDP